jgi:cytochrome P460
MKTVTVMMLALFASLADGQPPSRPSILITGRDAGTEPAYDSQGRLQPPLKYREWVYLTSGIDMSYSPKPVMEMESMFDNVFVNPAAYRTFLETGTWPDKTVLVLEQRGAAGPSSINKRGHSQSGEIMGFEVHVRDEAKTPGKWAFYDFENAQPTEQIPQAAACYSCHEQHAAVATTFVQFYPTLLPVAKKKKTLSANYLKELVDAPKP